MSRLIIALLMIVVLLTSSIIMGCDVHGPRLCSEGDELYEQGRLVEAIDKYTEALKYSPTWEELFWKRGVAYCDLGQYERGIEDFNEAIHIAPNYGDPYYCRGLAYAEQGKKADAIADFEKFISLSDIDNTQWIPLAKQKIEELSQ